MLPLRSSAPPCVQEPSSHNRGGCRSQNRDPTRNQASIVVSDHYHNDLYLHNRQRPPGFSSRSSWDPCSPPWVWRSHRKPFETKLSTLEAAVSRQNSLSSLRTLVLCLPAPQNRPATSRGTFPDGLSGPAVSRQLDVVILVSHAAIIDESITYLCPPAEDPRVNPPPSSVSPEKRKMGRIAVIK